MIPVIKFPDFDPKDGDKKKIDFPDFHKKTHENIGYFGRLTKKLEIFCSEKFGVNSKITKFVSKLNSSPKRDSSLDSLSRIKKNRSVWDQVNLALLILLMIILFFAWKNGPDFIKKIEQNKVDFNSQKEVIKMEKENNEYLATLAAGSNKLTEKKELVDSAIPDNDEKVEEVISMLEDIANKQNEMKIDAISIRKIAESQFYYDELVGYVQPYEYIFSVKGNLPTILSFIMAIKSSIRIMDIMTLEISEDKDGFKANMSLFVYHIINETAEDTESAKP